MTTPRALALAGSLLFAAAGCAPHVRVVVSNGSGVRLAVDSIGAVRVTVRATGY